MKKNLLFSLIGLVINILLPAQTIYQHIQDEALYGFLDEMETIHLLDINTAIKPYSRAHIAGWLIELEQLADKLSHSQKARLALYRQEFALEMHKLKTGKLSLWQKANNLSVHLGPPEVTWMDTLSRILLRPIYGIRVFRSSADNFFHSYGGLEAKAYIGNNWGFSADIRDNYMQQAILSFPEYLTKEPGGNFKVGVQGRSGGDYSEMRGNITYTWKWGHIGLVKDHIEWGSNYNGSNIFSGRTPSFAMIKLHLNPVKWLSFDYFHGWLVSEVTDSLRSVFMPDGAYRKVFYEKYIAANTFTFRPFKRFHIALGNAIIYDQQNPHPAYFFPFNFFKSIPHTVKKGITTNDNSMMFVNISSRQIKHLHIYYTWYVDELSIVRINDPERHNFFSHKGGFALSGWPARNLTINYEMTYTKPMTYQHRVPTTTFETNRFNLGHYLRDNSRDYYLAFKYNPFSTLLFTASYTHAQKGNLYVYKHGNEVPVDQNPVLQDITWENTTIAFRAQWLPWPNLRVFAEYQHSNIAGYDVDEKTGEDYLNMFTPNYLHGKTNTLVMGFGYGFN
jgi:hypothetical protein